jgi:hypothetical protein
MTAADQLSHSFGRRPKGIEHSPRPKNRFAKIIFVVALIVVAVTGIGQLQYLNREERYLDAAQNLLTHEPGVRMVGIIRNSVRPFSPTKRLVFAMPMDLKTTFLGNRGMFFVIAAAYGEKPYSDIALSDCRARKEKMRATDGKVVDFSEPTPAPNEMSELPGWIPALCNSNWSAETAVLQKKYAQRKSREPQLKLP